MRQSWLKYSTRKRRGFGPERLVLFVVLLDARLLVVDVERRDDAFGENPRAELAGGLPRDAAIENELHVIGPAEVEILAHDLFEQMAACARPVEDLGQGEFRLEDRELVAIPRGTVGGGEGMRQAAEPLAHDGVDFRRIQGLGDALHAGGRVSGPDAIVERFVGDAALGAGV